MQDQGKTLEAGKRRSDEYITATQWRILADPEGEDGETEKQELVPKRLGSASMANYDRINSGSAPITTVVSVYLEKII